MRDKYCDVEDILRILGTELAIQRADELKKEAEVRREEYKKMGDKQSEVNHD